MKKYPECCYRLNGNKFSCGDRTYFTSENGYWIGSPNLYEYGFFCEEEQEIVGITAETLIELGKENGDSIDISSYLYGINKGDSVVVHRENPVFMWRIKNEENEPILGKFFLQVSKELKYLK